MLGNFYLYAAGQADLAVWAAGVAKIAAYFQAVSGIDWKYANAA